MYYHIAAILKSSSTIKDALSRIAQSSGCKGAFMVITNAYLSGNNLVLGYNGINDSSIAGVTLRYELSDSNGSNVIRGQATVSITPGLNQSVSIALNKTVSGQDHLIISNNNIVFYNSSIGM